MNKQTVRLLSVTALCAVSVQCKTPSQAKTDDSAGQTAVVTPAVRSMVRDSSPANHMPRAVVYKTNGDYNDHVAVNLDADGKTLVSYPAVSDVSASSSALPVARGWLLDRRGGTGLNTAFLTWTYAEYAAMKSTPSQAEIMAHSIPGAEVTEVRRLSMSASQARQDTSAVNAEINAWPVNGNNK